MKNFLIGFCLILFCNSFVHSQQEMMWDAKFAIGGGFTPGWIIPDVEEINNMLEGFGTGKFSTSGFFATGGIGYISIAVVKNVRIGMMGLGGSMNKTGNGNESKYSLSMLGFSMEYTFPFIPSVAVSVGAVIGGGNVTLELYRYDENAAWTWNNIWDEINDGNRNASLISRKISNSYFTVVPTLNVDIPVNRFISFRVGGGYQIALGDNWEVDNGNSISGVPSGLNSNALFVQTGILIGYFNY